MRRTPLKFFFTFENKHWYSETYSNRKRLHSIFSTLILWSKTVGRRDFFPYFRKTFTQTPPRKIQKKQQTIKWIVCCCFDGSMSLHACKQNNPGKLEKSMTTSLKMQPFSKNFVKCSTNKFFKQLKKLVSINEIHEHLEEQKSSPMDQQVTAISYQT